MSMPTSIEKTSSHSIGDILRRTAARYPLKTALIDSNFECSYAELNEATNLVANNLKSFNIQKGDRIAIVSRNCWEFVVLAYATAKIGAILVPINFMLKSHEIAFILEDSTPVAVFAQPEFKENIEAAITSAVIQNVRKILFNKQSSVAEDWTAFTELVETGNVSDPEVYIADNDPLRIMYTSGTESNPKGVVHSSRSLIAEYVSCIVDGGMTSDDVDLHTLPFYHCAQLDCFLGPDIYLGATSIILPDPEPTRVLRTIEEKNVTKYFAPPTVWISLLRSEKFDKTDLSSLKKGYYGASPMPVEILKELIHRLPNLKLWNFYGQTELAPVATILQPEEQTLFPGSAGRPVLNVETKIMGDDGSFLEKGETGEVVHRGPHITQGYWKNDEKTTEAFAHGWFHSGDLGFFDADGRLTIVDRKKDVIKTGGENVASREVEETLYGHQAVAEVAVFATPHEKWVETVTAAVVLKEGKTVSEQEIIDYARSILAVYKAPTIVKFYDSLPKNPSGKILKRELRENFNTR